MLIQIHKRFQDGSTEFVAQQDIVTGSQFLEFKKGTIEEHTIPKGAEWISCTSDSPYFLHGGKNNG